MCVSATNPRLTLEIRRRLCACATNALLALETQSSSECIRKRPKSASTRGDYSHENAPWRRRRLCVFANAGNSLLACVRKRPKLKCQYIVGVKL